jgi:hypothetical protein
MHDEVKVIVDEKVVAVPLADDAEIVHRSFLRTDSGVELILSNTGTLILLASRLADTANPCGWKWNAPWIAPDEVTLKRNSTCK